MNTFRWGLLGPGGLSSTRRSRSLGINTAIRYYNERAVPGLGGVRFAKQVFLATLGVLVAQKARQNGAKVKNIEVTNAIEALACYLALERNNWTTDVRLRGSTKLAGKEKDFSFARAKQPSFYVTQPMRMACVQTLPALGLVESNGQQFNAFSYSQRGESFIEHACRQFRPANQSVISYLTKWVLGDGIQTNSNKLSLALSPLEPLPAQACKLLREYLVQDTYIEPSLHGRRSAALAWVDELRNQKASTAQWSVQPASITEPHWQDLKNGAQFFKVRDSAIKVLNTLENYLGQQHERALCLQQELPKVLTLPLKKLNADAQVFLKATGEQEDSARAFCTECSNVDAKKVIQSLVKRDSVVLKLSGAQIRPGSAFYGSGLINIDPETQGQEELSVGNNIQLPAYISRRLHNLFLLNADLQGDLLQWVSQDSMESPHES